MCKINTTLYVYVILICLMFTQKNMFSSQVLVIEETNVTSTKSKKCYHVIYLTHNHFSRLGKKQRNKTYISNDTQVNDHMLMQLL